MGAFTLPLSLFLSVMMLGMWAFVSIVTWADMRRREREAFYKSETLKRLSEMPGETGLALLRENERNARRKRREDIKLGGLVTTAVGIGLMLFLRALVPDRAVYVTGLIPLLIGVALLLHSYVFGPKD